MRLNPFNTGNINVRGSSGGGVGKAGGLGCGTIVIAALGYFVFGLDPFQTAATVESVQQGTQAQGEISTDQNEVCTTGPYAREACDGLLSLDQTWGRVFEEQGFGDRFQRPTLHLYSGAVRTACGSGSSSMGPFYCPGDQTIYIDTSFYDQLARMSGNSGDFARYYVLAHEYGHHIQTITGVSDQIRSVQGQVGRTQGNQLQVRMELQADCYAGVWAGRNRNLIEPGDIEEGMQAASAIGDDRLTQGRVSAENFTHGTSAQRSQALQAGLRGDDRVCDEYTNLS
ncbi:KPN_02809 family neutral zinc metallopeptidase [Qipengyuania huizhouensis]|uniref:KPN_02809 family neutral zinc metallopeptidase n=1 Tax=Qipengyuania huizhouensis TaxID=2867245 RepID=UPI00185643F4|nr:neutral zinc metallopeptidase [Qipengyuania huizhouensis]MBA4764982.1 neutral zinc metallopeptidase [Erythrobacter sp.]MBX7461704.1 neutral zinc metallopeptidase [Qipengyuania huizhouensis]